MFQKMNKKDILYNLLILLLCINGFLVFKLYSFDNAKPKEFRKPPHQILVDRLHFSKHQIKALDTLYSGRENELMEMGMYMSQQKNALFEYSKTEKYDTNKVKYFANEIGLTMSRMDVKVFELLRGIRLICDVKQKKEFDKIFKDVFHKEGKEQHMKMNENIKR